MKEPDSLDRERTEAVRAELRARLASRLRSGSGIDRRDHILTMGRETPVLPESARVRFVEKFNLAEKLATFSEHWSPKVVAALNGQEVKLAKVQGSFDWHHHEDEDELFLVITGRLRMDFRDHSVWLEEGEAIVVPRGVEHRPHADVETSILLFEPATTLNTGNVRSERTVDRPEHI